MSIVGAVGLLFVLPLLGACSSSSSFWDRSPCVAGARQVAPDCGCPPSYTPPSRCAPPKAAAPNCAPPQYRTQQPPAYEPPAAQAPTYAAPPAQGPVHAPASTQEMALLDRVNRIRAQHSLRPLRFEPNLWIAARDHSKEQQRHGYMGHGSPDPSRRQLGQRMKLARYGGGVYAEVVAWGYSDTASVVEGWMNSTDHRRILLDPELTEGAFSRIGEFWTGNLGAPRRFSQGAPVNPNAGTTFRRAPAPRASPRASVPRSAPAPRAATPAPRRTQPAPRRAQPKPAPRRQALPLKPRAPTSGFG